MLGTPRALAVAAILAVVAACNDNSSGEVTSPQVGSRVVAGGEVAAPADEVLLAKVGDAGGVTAEDFAEVAARTPPADGRALTLEERKALLDKLVVEEALFQEAAKQGLHRDPKVRKIMVNLLMREEVYANVKASDFSPEQLKAYFDTHQEEFVVPEKVQIKRIFLKVGEERSLEKAMALAKDLRGKIMSNRDTFKDLALEYSEDPYKRRGGDLGYISVEGKPGIDPLVVSTAFGLEENAVSEAFEAGGGVNIVYVPKRRERVERTFEQMKGSVLRKLKNERYKELTETYVEGVRGRYAVDIDEAALSNAPVQSSRIGGPEHLGAEEDPDHEGLEAEDEELH